MYSILIITSEFPPQPGGIGIHAYQLAKGLSSKGYRVTVVCDQRSSDGKEEEQFDSKQVFQVVRIKRHSLIFWSYLKRIFSSFKLVGAVDIVLASGKFSLWQVAFLRKLRKRKYVAVLHGTEILLPNRMLRKLTDYSLKQFHSLIAVSNYTKSLVSHINHKKVHVIPNGFEINTSTRKDNIPSLVPRLITVGNLTRRKGQLNIIEALPVLLESYPNMEYHMVGIPTEKKVMEERALELGVLDSVFFYGRVEEDVKRKLLLESDIFVMLSEETDDGDVEGFGIAIIEANALGLPAIGSLGCGIEDAINNGVSGKLIYHKDPEQLVKAVKEILDDYSKYSQESILWADNFTWDKVIEKYVEVIEAVGSH